MRRTPERVLLVVLVILLMGGTSYAAVQITGKDVKNSSLTGKDVKDGSLLRGDFGAGELPSGAPGPVGPSGARGLPGSPGPTGAAGPTAKKIDLHVRQSEAPFVAVTLGGGFEMRLLCGGGVGHRELLVEAKGPGAVQLDFLSSMDDNSASALIVPGGANLGTVFGQVIAIGADHGLGANTTGHYFRAGGTAVLHGASVVTLVFDAFLDDRDSSQTTCYLRGTATLAE